MINYIELLLERQQHRHAFFIAFSIFSFFLVVTLGNLGFGANNGIKSVYGINETLSVVTSVSPITNIVKNIGGDKINLIGLVPEGVNSHTFELVPSNVINLNKADLVIIDGLHLEDNIEKAVDATLKKHPQIQLLKLGDNTINSAQWVFDFSFPKEKGIPNPHLWLNVAYAMKFANLTRDKLIEMDPNNADYYTENAKKYHNLLAQLDSGIIDSVKTIPAENRKLLTYHDSWAYFAPRYNMTVIGAIQPSDFSEPSPLDMAKLIDQIKQEKVPAIFASEVFSNKIVDQIARESHVAIVQTLRDDALPGDPNDRNHTYVGMMIENMKNMVIPLGGNINELLALDPGNTFN
jgi:ABC-type Zn uptake system ZnuABC Zn-binding protein ZnuA